MPAKVKLEQEDIMNIKIYVLGEKQINEIQLRAQK